MIVIEYRGRKISIPNNLYNEYKEIYGSFVSEIELDMYVNAACGIDPKSDMDMLKSIPNERLSTAITDAMNNEMDFMRTT